MQFITYMNVESLATRFLPLVEDPSRFMFLTASLNVKTDKSLPNTEDVKELVPPQYVVTDLSRGKKHFQKMYENYLSDPEIAYLITVIVRMMTEHPNMCVILVNSPSEAEYGYMEVLLNHIEELYGLPYIKPGKVVKAFEEGKQFELSLGSKEMLEEVNILATNRYDEYVRMGILSKTERELGEEVQRMIDELEDLKRKKLEKIAKAQNVKFNRDTSKRKLIKKIALKYQDMLVKEIQERKLPTAPDDEPANGAAPEAPSTETN